MYVYVKARRTQNKDNVKIGKIINEFRVHVETSVEVTM